jgi:hypothetical protein
VLTERRVGGADVVDELIAQQQCGKVGHEARCGLTGRCRGPDRLQLLVGVAVAQHVAETGIREGRRP